MQTNPYSLDALLRVKPTVADFAVNAVESFLSVRCWGPQLWPCVFA